MVASGGGDHLPEIMTRPELIRLLDSTREALAETQDQLSAVQKQLADSDQRAAAERDQALRLQRALMPPDVRLLLAPGADIAARCRPARAGFLVAGDWYDALALPGGDLLFVVGDIAGHGLEAVSGMIAARHALRGLAATGAEPAELIAALNRCACLFADGVTGTVICGRYSPGDRVLRWARAGHLPLVLVRGETALLPPLPEGMLLGVHPECVYRQHELQLEPADTLLLFTDGMIERRAGSISDALAEFAAAAGPVGPDLDDHVAGLLAGSRSDTGDDACLLAVRVS
jgi:serine phosphatase RsbU (regulator of sigma subunit)